MKGNLMKTCIKCNQKKHPSEFYAHKQMADGTLNKCKQCCIEAAKKRREEKLDEIREYDRKRGSLPHRLEANRLRQKSAKGKESHNAANRRYKEKYKNRAAARYIFLNAIRDGKIKRWPCQVCGHEYAEGHHPDYDRPLDVVWLCVKHHKETHKLANHLERQSK
jgi:hypothetical protein